MSRRSQPLYISKVPTVISLCQMEEDGKEKLLNHRDLPGSKLPRMSFTKKDNLGKSKRVRSFGDLQHVPDMDDCSGSSDNMSPSEDEDAMMSRSMFDMTLLAKWEAAAEDELFRYDVTACPTKCLQGKYGFIAQLNEGRATKKRATEFRVDKVCQDFDESKFNFKKVSQKEVIFVFEESRTMTASFDDAKVVGDESPNMVLINVSPIEYGHILLVPSVLDSLPQQIHPDHLLLALQMAAEANNPFFRVGYNSLGAYATINHLHFQAYYLAAAFPVERAPTVKLFDRMCCGSSVLVSKLASYPVRGLVFEVGDSLSAMAELVGNFCMQLQTMNQPFNVLVVDRGARVFVFPQCFAERMANGQVPQHIVETGVNPAAFEIAGHILLKQGQDYSMCTEEDAWELLAAASLPEDYFEELIDLCFAEARDMCLEGILEDR
mmetsp:Transcript_7457/g.45832  ORF Transcript_7457/g.45832 Transcript_7457/m.45832 type:complete len:435 (-) Transcript_7457:1991-3295(-)|eukprot:CAMPEP_0183826268 /NCGR_PEP_ID=MMETSP0807_2-20130328/1604_1 /TAXON_ID=88271 /ORGANISM="Picocystis salinarum, Strain CCMP1897" /LENGTH=434 /DNA_ID=CAMNT_0026071367 /DNA_START=579 /DNA_END=1883 /DNA_ORIENTATION=+